MPTAGLCEIEQGRFPRDLRFYYSPFTDKNELGEEISEALEFEVESMPNRPFILDGVRFGSGEQTCVDHGDHELLCGKDSDSPISTPCLDDGSTVVDCQEMLSMNDDGDGGAFTGSQASGRRQRSEE